MDKQDKTIKIPSKTYKDLLKLKDSSGVSMRRIVQMAIEEYIKINK